MDYLFEAVVIIGALLFPLFFFVLFLHGLIQGLGDATSITKTEDFSEE